MLNFKAKPVIAMLHLKGTSDEEIMERMIKETGITICNLNFSDKAFHR